MYQALRSSVRLGQLDFGSAFEFLRCAGLSAADDLAAYLCLVRQDVVVIPLLSETVQRQANLALHHKFGYAQKYVILGQIQE